MRLRIATLWRELPRSTNRAAWAGAHHLGPIVHFRHPPLGAFSSDFVPGDVPSLIDVGGTKLPIFAEALARLHRQDPADVPGGGHVNWLIAHLDATKIFAATKAPARPKTLVHAVWQVEAGLERFIGRRAYVPVPIQDDFKPDNTLLNGTKLTVLD